MHSNLLWIFEMANNHGGSVDHAKRIIDGFYELKEKYKLHAAIKFQFRQLDSFIHDSFKESDLKYVKRFAETRLEKDEFAEICQYAKQRGF